MKAKDLIAKLQELDPETEIVAQDCSYCEGSEEMTISFEKTEHIIGWAPNATRIPAVRITGGSYG